jgi:hypothetical protein
MRTNLATVAGLTGDQAAWEQFDQCLATGEASGLDEDVTPHPAQPGHLRDPAT